MSVVNVPLKDGTAAVARAAADASAEARMFRRPSEWRIFWEAFSRDRLALAAAAVIVLVCLAAGLAPVVSPYDPTVGNNALRLAPIGTPGHLLGLDGQGRDILSRLLWGGQVSLIIALLPVTVASEAGAMNVLARAFQNIKPGNALMYYPEANVLVPSHCDPASRTPAFKHVLVTIEKASTGTRRATAEGEPALKVASVGGNRGNLRAC